MQGFHDLVLFSCVAVSSLVSGQVLNAFGWNVLSLVFWPVVIACFGFLLLNSARGRRGVSTY